MPPPVRRENGIADGMSCPLRREHCFMRALTFLPHAAECGRARRLSVQLFVGDDWSEKHHDVELMDAAGRRLSKARLPEGVAGIARLHSMIGDQLGDDVDQSEVAIGIEIDRGPWVAALVTAGHTARGESVAGGRFPGNTPCFGSEVRRRRRTRVGGHGAHRVAPPPGPTAHRAGRPGSDRSWSRRHGGGLSAAPL